MNIAKEALLEIIDRHGKWLRDEKDGARAYLRDADLRGADLSSAYLSSAYLGGANLSSANLRDVIGGASRVQCLQIDPYKIIILDKEIVWGGCTKKTVQEWLDYSGEELNEKNKLYLETITKPFIRMVCGV